MTDHGRDNVIRGMLYMAASAGFFAIMTAIVKQLGAHYSVFQIIFFRCVFSLPPVLAVMLHRNGRIALPPTKRLAGHTLRTVTGLISMGCIFYSFTYLPLADALAISSSGPLFTALFAVLWLGEKVGWRRWVAMGIGFLGVVIMAQPTGDLTYGGVAFALAGAIFYAMAMTSVRSLGRTENPDTTVFFFSLLSTVLSLLPLPFIWQTPTAGDWLVFAGSGLIAFCVQMMLSRAYFHAPAAVVTPLNYTAIVWGALLGYVFWQEQPTPRVILGAVIVTGASAFIAWREARRKSKVTRLPDVPPPA